MKQKDITLTPLKLIKEIGIFDLDPCGFNGHKTANKLYLLPKEDGLQKEWFGKVWLNPPYSETIKWIKKMAKHNNGIACVLASTETKWFQEYVLKRANSIFFLESRPKFLNNKFKVVNLMRGVVLVSYGDCIEMLRECTLQGTFVELNNTSTRYSAYGTKSKPEVNSPCLSQNNTKEDGFPPTPKGMGIQPTIL